MEKLTPNQIWQEYQSIKDYCQQRDLFQIVETNENFYDGRQWEGLDAPNMPKPVINILQRVVKYMIATLSSNDISISIKPYSSNQADEELAKPIIQEVMNVIEQARMKDASRLVIRNGAVDGSAYMLQMFDETIDSGQALNGRITNQVIDNTQVYFGNPYDNRVQKQPYIIVALRQQLSSVQREARELGLNEDLIESIQPDNQYDQANDDSQKLVTVLLRFEKKTTKEKVIIDGVEVEKRKSSVYFTKSTQNVMLIDETNLGYKRYPLSQFGWDSIKNSYLFNSPLTAVIPNQIFINKSFAIAQMYAQLSSMPKIVYDKSKIDINDILDNTTPSAVANIDLMGKFLDFIKVPDFSNNIMALIDKTEVDTKECMGVNDAALGNVKPDNTSAIIALQESSNMPLEIQRQTFYEFWEDTIRNILDIMSVDYGERQVMVDDDLATVNFNVLNNINYNLNVDIGAGSQYSEIAQIQTMDKLLQAGIIDPQTYIESIPAKYLLNKQKIIAKYKEQQEQQEDLQQINPSQVL